MCLFFDHGVFGIMNADCWLVTEFFHVVLLCQSSVYVCLIWFLCICSFPLHWPRRENWMKCVGVGHHLNNPSLKRGIVLSVLHRMRRWDQLPRNKDMMDNLFKTHFMLLCVLFFSMAQFCLCSVANIRLKLSILPKLWFRHTWKGFNLSLTGLDIVVFSLLQDETRGGLRKEC